ncbi:MAG: hypothetical protein KDI67_01110 [Gammaproteobacteria bacterium]|nr:hypothetical protein [Gammaproteobacteria bacterium]
MLDDATKVDLVGAVRYTKLATDTVVRIASVPVIVFPGGATSAEGSDSWVDAVVGARALYPDSGSLVLLGYSDVGGSDLTCELIGGVNWNFSKGCTAIFGYR